MRISLKALSATAAAFMLSALALAQDAPSIPVAQPPVLPPAIPATAPVAAAAAATAPTAPAPTLSYGMSFGEAWSYGGFIMWILLVISVVMLALVIYFFCVLRPNAVVPRRLRSDVRNYLKEGDANSARRLCEDKSCAFSSIVLAALDYIRETPHFENDQLLRDVVESEGVRQAESLQSQTQLLLDLSAIAPMLGLLGTTLGMLKAFGAVAQDMVAAKPIILAQGVSQAIVTTIFGLFVAIPCMAFYAYFRRRTSRVTGLLEKASADVVTAIAVRRDA